MYRIRVHAQPTPLHLLAFIFCLFFHTKQMTFHIYSGLVLKQKHNQLKKQQISRRENWEIFGHHTATAWYSSSIAKYAEKHSFRVWSAIGHRQDERMTIGLTAAVAGHARICSRTRICALRVSPTCTEGCGHPFLKYAHLCPRTKRVFWSFSARSQYNYGAVTSLVCRSIVIASCTRQCLALIYKFLTCERLYNFNYNLEWN